MAAVSFYPLLVCAGAEPLSQLLLSAASTASEQSELEPVWILQRQGLVRNKRSLLEAAAAGRETLSGGEVQLRGQVSFYLYALSLPGQRLTTALHSIWSRAGASIGGSAARAGTERSTAAGRARRQGRVSIISFDLDDTVSFSACAQTGMRESSLCSRS